MEDDSLYNAMIWALAIGIVIVIVTLFATRPQPESFTELYFNNHTFLPEYSQNNTRYNYSFSIHNMENKNMTYVYNITTELYNYDYSCETPDIYLEPINNSREATTNDPTLLITEKYYNISFSYTMISGDQILEYSLRDIDNNKTFTLTLDHENNIAELKTTDRIYTTNLNTTKTLHNIKFYFSEKNTTINLDNTNIFEIQTPKGYTTGYPSFTTYNTYAEIYNMIIFRPAKENVNVRIEDAVYKSLSLQKNTSQGIVIIYPKYLSKAVYDKIFNTPTIQTVKDNYAILYSTGSVNITNQTITADFKSANATLGIKDRLMINYVNKTMTINTPTTDYRRFVNETVTEIKIKSFDKSATIYYNNKPLLNITLDTINVMPFVLFNDKTGTLQSFNIKDNSEPRTLQYTIPGTIQSVSYGNIYEPAVIPQIAEELKNATKNNITGQDTTSRDRLAQFIEEQKINWTGYRISVVYLDPSRNNTFTIAMTSLNETYYSFSADSKNNTVRLQLLQNGTLKNYSYNVTPSNIERLFMDIDNNTINIYLNDQNIIYAPVDKTTGGLLVMDSKNISVLSAQTQNKEDNQVTIYRKAQLTCDPVLTKTIKYNNTEHLNDKETKIFNGYYEIRDPYDYARISIALNTGEEIHFITKGLN